MPHASSSHHGMQQEWPPGHDYRTGTPPGDDHQFGRYLHSRSRQELIDLVLAEREANKQNEERYSDDQEAIIVSLSRRLKTAEEFNQELQEVVRDLREELSALSIQSQSRHGRSTRFRHGGDSPLPVYSPRVDIRPPTSPSSTSSHSNYDNGANLTASQSNTSASTSSSSDPEKDTIMQLGALNGAIISIATQLSKTLQYNDNDLLLTVPDRRSIDTLQRSLVRSTWVVGQRVACELAAFPLPKDAISERSPSPLLAEMVYEIVFAKWAAFILGYVDNNLSDAGPEAHHWYQTVYNLRSTHVNDETWVASIMQCIRDVTYISGWAFRPSNRKDDISLIPLILAVEGVKRALDKLRLSTTSGGVADIYLVPPGANFESPPNVMRDAFAIGKRSFFGGVTRLRRGSNVEKTKVIACTGLGLRRPPGNPSELRLTPAPLVAPRVVLECAFMNAFSRSAQLEEPKVRVRVGGGRSTAVASVKVRG